MREVAPAPLKGGSRHEYDIKMEIILLMSYKDISVIILHSIAVI